MILTEEVVVMISGRNLQYYRNLNYDCNYNESIIVDIKDLYSGSGIKISAKCDICNTKNKNKIMYSSYCNSLKFDGLYYCMKCSGIKRRKVCLEKFGVENVSQLKEVKEKKKKTNIKNWGTENVFQNEDIKIKSKKTKKEKYNDENYTNSAKTMKTIIAKYGVKYPMQSEKIKETRNKNNKEKYGVEHYTQTQQYIDNIKLTNNEKYNTDWYMESDDFKEKSKETNIKLYGVEIPMCNTEIALKMKETKIKNGHYLSDDQLSSFKKYKNEVTRLTKKVKQELYTKWDGYDYYDNEYIAENFLLKHTDKNFPTIDHMKSVYYGFRNNISEKDIADINNLCITKMSINSKKNRK